MARIENGIRFGNHFSVDPTRKSDLAIVSHAHSDHVKAHRKILATGPTIELARIRYKKFEAATVQFHSEFKIGPATVELAPAGHMLGSAQVILDWHGERIVYTGDFKLEKNYTCAKAAIHPCDTLLIDATYGKPHYRFPPLAECRERLLEFVAGNIAAGVVPVILAYSLGKAQEAMKILSDEDIEIDAHKTAYEAAMIYGRFGVEIKGLHMLDGKPNRGRALIMPPGGFRYINPYGWGRFKTCLLSGWTIDRRYGFQGGNSTGIPFSDHASYDDIVRYIEIAKPKSVFTLFGPPDVAEYLRRIGFNAEAADLSRGRSLGRKGGGNMDLFA